MQRTWVLNSVNALPPSKLARAVELLLDHRQLVLQDFAAMEAVLREFRARPSPGFSDCLMLASATAARAVAIDTGSIELAANFALFDVPSNDSMAESTAR